MASPALRAYEQAGLKFAGRTSSMRRTWRISTANPASQYMRRVSLLSQVRGKPNVDVPKPLEKGSRIFPEVRVYEANNS